MNHSLNIFRIIGFLIAATIIAALAGCARQEKKYRIGVSQCSAESWRWKTNDEILREKMFHDNVEVEIRSADDQNEKQIDDIRYFIDNDFDLIIANPNQEDAITPIINEAYSKGIPVVTFDRRINGDSYTVHIEVDNEAIGQSVARYALHLFPTGPVRVIEIQGDTTMTPTKKRHAGFINEMKKHPRVEIVATAYPNWNPDSTAAKIAPLLKQHPDIDLIYAHSDVMAISAAETARSLGLTGIRFLGIDGNPDVGIKAVADSVTDATFLYPTYGARLLNTALDILDGRPVERDITIPPLSPVDKSNADILLQQDSLIKSETAKIQLLKDQIDIFWQRHSAQSTLLYATIAIVVLLIGIILLIWRTYAQHRRHRRILTRQNAMLQEERDKQKDLYRQLEEATNSKLVFFTNVSHDLRTPLTLIAEPLRQMIADPDMPSSRRLSLLHIADKNAGILKRLIDQILDFRKYENGKLTLHTEEVRFYDAVRDWLGAFDAAIAGKDIKLTADIPADNSFSLAIDSEKLESVFFNIMSNAIKYTPRNGHISIECHNSPSELTFSISDSGKGIAKEDLDRIFERFYQADKVHPEGSGIGLAVAKAFVELHGGTLRAESEKGKGARFTVTIPITHTDQFHVADGTDNTGNFRNRADDATPINESESDCEAPAILSEASTGDDDKPLLLIIDDNKDICDMIASLMSDEYTVISASGGSRGIRLATKYTPDIIICDVMMPGMTGMECCKILKNEISTSHIPILMLTACALDRQRLEGYQSGADGYLPKPFDGEMLKARCRNLIDNRRRIRNVYAADSTAPIERRRFSTPRGADADGNVESDFYNRFIRIVESRLGNSDLGIEQIASEMGLGKSQLSRKIKALTNYSPVEIIRNMRLKRARHLITTTKKSISEIAYEVGFSLPAYFSKCYKDYYHEAPSELRSRLDADK